MRPEETSASLPEEEIQPITAGGWLVLGSEGVIVNGAGEVKVFVSPGVGDRLSLTGDNLGQLKHYYPPWDQRYSHSSYELRPGDWLGYSGRHYYLEQNDSGGVDLVPDKLVDPAKIINKGVDVVADKKGVRFLSAYRFRDKTVPEGYASVYHPSMPVEGISFSKKELEQALREDRTLKLGDLPYGLKVIPKIRGRYHLQAVKLETETAAQSPADLWRQKIDASLAEGEAPPAPPPAETTKKKSKLNISIRGLLKKVSQEWKQSKKLRGVREAATLVLAALTDVAPASGLVYAGYNLIISLGTGALGLADKYVDIAENEFSGKLGLTREEFNGETSRFKLLFKSAWRNSFWAKALGKNPELDLAKSERAWATALGAGGALGALAIAELVKTGIPVPVVRSLASRLLVRLAVQELLPRALIEIGGMMFKEKEGSVEKAEDFVELSLSAMSATFVALTTGMMAYQGLANLENRPEVQPLEATPTAEPSNTATATLAATVTSGATATPEPTPAPTETATPLPLIEWVPGEAVSDQVLETAAASHHAWGLDEVQIFYLDNNQTPDYLITEGNHLINDGSGNFFLDANNNGLIDLPEKTASWTWESLTQIDPRLEGLDQTEPVPGGDYSPVEAEQILGFTPGKVEAAPLLPEDKLADLPPPDRYDFNADGVADILRQDDGSLYADMDQSGSFTPGDTKVTELNLGYDNQPDLIKYENGSSWMRQEDGTIVGTLSDGRTLDLDPRGKLSGLQLELHRLNPAWSPEAVGRYAFLNQTVSLDEAASIQPQVYTPPEGPLTFDQLALGPEGGQVGILQQQIHEANPGLSATQVAAAAHIASVNNHLSGAAMVQDVNATLTRFSLENELGKLMAEKGIRNDYIYAYARQAAFAAIQHDDIVWHFPSDAIYGQPLSFEQISSYSGQSLNWWSDWLEEWLRQNGYSD